MHNTIHMRVSHSSQLHGQYLLAWIIHGNVFSVVILAGLGHIVMSASQHLDVVSNLFFPLSSSSSPLSHTHTHSLTVYIFLARSDWLQMRMEDTALSLMSASVTLAMQETCVKLVHTHCT